MGYAIGTQKFPTPKKWIPNQNYRVALEELEVPNATGLQEFNDRIRFAARAG